MVQQRPPEKPKDIPQEASLTHESSFGVETLPTEQSSVPPEHVSLAQPEQAPIHSHQESQQEKETVPEQSHDTTSPEGTMAVMKRKLFSSKKQKQHDIPQVRDDLTLQIESIMSFGLDDAFKALTPVQQQEFKIKGEATAREIRRMLTHTRVKIKKIFALIVEWLKLLPGINKFYLEQEAKIKTDKLMSLHEQQKHMEN